MSNVAIEENFSAFLRYMEAQIIYSPVLLTQVYRTCVSICNLSFILPNISVFRHLSILGDFSAPIGLNRCPHPPGADSNV